jgi:oligopeptide/dipeptide ABC transporter ATP-binding protein
MNDAEPVLSIHDLSVTYAGGVQAVRGVGLELRAGEIVALVGESGCGKSTVALAVQGLLPSSARVTGAVRVGGTLLGGPDRERLRRAMRGRWIGFVAQEPAGSFNPTWRVGSHVSEARRLHAREPAGRSLRAWAAERLAALQIDDAGRRARQYPHQWSGGMLQRAALAAALANDPPLLIADEPTASLDAPLAVEIMDQISAAVRGSGGGMLLITHHLGLAARVADHIAVMYAGRIVEIGDAAATMSRPRHPYARALVSAMPRFGTILPAALDGEPPGLSPPPAGCAFAPRCALAQPACADGPAPELRNGIACPVVSAGSEPEGGAGDD